MIAYRFILVLSLSRLEEMNSWWLILLFSALKAQAGLHRPEGIVKILFDTKAAWMILPYLGKITK